MVFLYIQFPPLPEVAVLAVSNSHIVTSIFEVLVLVTDAAPINFFSVLVDASRELTVMPNCVSFTKLFNVVATYSLTINISNSHETLAVPVDTLAIKPISVGPTYGPKGTSVCPNVSIDPPDTPETTD